LRIERWNRGQASGAATGAMGATSSDQMDLARGMYGGAIGGAVSSQMENCGYTHPVAVAVGGAVGGSLGV
jgi:hypothetical protein